MSDPGLSAVLAEHRWAPTELDAERMRRERHDRLQAEMARQGVDTLVLLHAPNIAYATGEPRRAEDVTHAVFGRLPAVVPAGGSPHLLEVCPELDEGARHLRDFAVGRVAVDELTGAMVRTGFQAELDASAVVGPAKLTKTPDELACIAEAQRRNEVAMVATQAFVRPGVRRSQVAGEFLAALPADTPNLIDPIFQPMPRSIADGPRTTTGDVAFPTGVGDPVLAEGDLVWVDTGVDHMGYASDFGRTWVVGRDPTPAEQGLFTRWCEVMLAVLDVLRPGVTAGDLVRVAGPDRPWLPHFYLAHGVGVESAEMPLVGTDLGADFDDRFVLTPGMVLVLEPAIWEDGIGGYRAEEIVTVTDTGWSHLGSGHNYEPFGS